MNPYEEINQTLEKERISAPFVPPTREQQAKLIRTMIEGFKRGGGSGPTLEKMERRLADLERIRPEDLPF